MIGHDAITAGIQRNEVRGDLDSDLTVLHTDKIKGQLSRGQEGAPRFNQLARVKGGGYC